MLRKNRIALLVPIFAILLSGCGKKDATTTGKVHGKVTYNGKLVTAGHVMFVAVGADTGGRYQAFIDKDGEYTVPDIPADVDMAVTVETESANPESKKKGKDQLRPGQKGPMENPNDQMRKHMGLPAPGEEGTSDFKGEYVPIPKRYAKLEGTPLHKKLNSGDQKWDIELTD